MAVYSNLAKLGRVSLPNAGGTTSTYALIDKDGRLMLAPFFADTASYAVDDYVIYQDNLYRCKTATTGAWAAAKWEQVTVGSELKALKAAIATGIHYRGYTTTSLYEGATTNPIVVGGTSKTMVAGDLVIETAPAYATGKAYAKGEYVTYQSNIYCVTAAITAANNTAWDKVTTRLAANEPEFLFDGTSWNEVGSLNPLGLGSLAYKNSASGLYTEPTGSGSVTMTTVSKTDTKLSLDAKTETVNKGYTANTTKLETTKITPVNGTESVSAVSGGSTKDIAKAGEAVVYGKADVGTAVTYGNANVAATATTVGNANVGTEVTVAKAGTAVKYGTANKASTATTVGNANVGTAVTVGAADVGEKTSVYSATTDPTKNSFATAGIVTNVDGDILVLSLASTSDAITGLTPIDIYPAKAATRQITPAAASSTTIYGAVDAPSTQTLTPVGETVGIKPAVASSTSIYGAVVSTTTLTPAVAAPTTQTIVPAVSNGTITGSYTISAKTVAKAGTEMNVATGGLKADDLSGATISTGITTTGTATALINTTKIKSGTTGDVDVVGSVTVGTKTETVTVGTKDGTVTVA